MGKPVIAGTRLTVELILEKLGAGETIDQLLQSHPRLTREAVLEAIGALEAEWREEAAKAREQAKAQGFDQQAIDRAVNAVRYGE